MLENKEFNMATPKQIAANRRNAKKSTGPKTGQGKATSSRNAMKHGILGTDMAHGGEDPAAFDALVEALREDLEPVGALEHGLVDQIAIAFWRNKRLAKAERDVLNHKREEPTIKYESILDNTPLHTTIKTIPVDIGTIDINKRMLFGRYQVMITNEIKRNLDMFYSARERRIESLQGVAEEIDTDLN